MDEPAAHPARPKLIYTCTPLAFSTNAPFFARETGHIHTELKALGVESRCILALPHDPRDLPEMEQWVIRTTLNNLELPEWWREQQLDGVFLYSWGAPRYTKIARAIHRAGIRLAIHLDMWDAPRYWMPELPFPKRLYRAIREFAVDFLRSKHLAHADIVTTSAPVQRGMRRLPFYKNIPFSFREMPCPVAPRFRYDGTHKNKRIVCVGRWDDVEVKRTDYLTKALALLTAQESEVEVTICGNNTPAMQQWHRELPEASRSRIHLRGFVASEFLPDIYKTAQIIFCPSLFESSCIAIAEALCCGCSVVCSNRPKHTTVIMSYATTPGCGRLPTEDSPESMAEALAAELDCWERGERNPETIATHWQPRFHPASILRDIFRL